MNNSDQDAERQRIQHHNDHLDSILVRFEDVRMALQPIGLRGLHVTEAMRRIPRVNHRTPMHRDAMHAQTIADLRPFEDRLLTCRGY